MTGWPALDFDRQEEQKSQYVTCLCGMLVAQNLKDFDFDFLSIGDLQIHCLGLVETATTDFGLPCLMKEYNDHDNSIIPCDKHS